jgi:hypothetical protein
VETVQKWAEEYASERKKLPSAQAEKELASLQVEMASMERQVQQRLVEALLDPAGTDGSGASSHSVSLISVTFAGGYNGGVDPSGNPINVICEDNGTNYAIPQWISSKQSPYGYQAGQQMMIEARIKVQGFPSSSGSGTPVWIQATNATGYGIQSTELALGNNGMIHLPPTPAGVTEATPAGKPFPTQVQFFDTFDLTWQFSWDGNSWQDVGVSSNCIFVTLGTPANLNIPCYRTLLYLACLKNTATKPEDAATATWANFSTSTPPNQFLGPKNVTTWNNLPLYYYKSGTKVVQNGLHIKDLLATYTGRCGAWAELLMAAWALNGVQSSKIVTSFVNPSTPADSDFLWVQNWTINNMGNPFYTYDILTAGDLLNAQGQPAPNNNYGAMTNINGVPGQNSHWPSQKCWLNHEIVQLQQDSLYYDPSYGMIYKDADDFVNNSKSIQCFGLYTGWDRTLHAQVFSLYPVSPTHNYIKF